MSPVMFDGLKNVVFVGFNHGTDNEHAGQCTVVHSASSHETLYNTQGDFRRQPPLISYISRLSALHYASLITNRTIFVIGTERM